MGELPPSVDKCLAPTAASVYDVLDTFLGTSMDMIDVKRSCDMKTLIEIWGKFPSGNNCSA